MAGTRQPTDVVVANGRKHLSRAEEAERRACEVQAPKPKTIKAPKWVPEQLKKEFRTLGKQLLLCGLYTDLDADTLGRYLVAHHQMRSTHRSPGICQPAQIFIQTYTPVQNCMGKQCLATKTEICKCTIQI